MSIKSPLSRQFGSRFDEVFDVVKSNPVYDKVSRIPTLDLDFAKSKSLYDGRSTKNLIDFVRNTAPNSSTYVDAAGLIKRSVTNLLLRSEEFETTWSRTTVTFFGSGSLVNTEAAPNGTLTADLVAVADGSNSGTGFISQDITKAATAATYTATVFAKAQNWNAVTLQVNDAATNNNRATVTFSLTTGQITTAAAAVGTFSAASAAAATSFGNGWFRASLTFTSSTETGLRIRIYPNNSTTVTSNGSNGVYLWGAQLEEASTAGEYVKTTATKSSAPRFDHNPTTGESLGLLVEESRQNLLLYSACDSNWPTGGFGTPTYNLGLSALGVFSGVQVASQGQNWHSIVRTGISLTASTVYAFTLFYRAGTSGRVRLTFRNNTATTETLVNGVAGNLSVSAAFAGAATILSQYLCSDGLTYVVTGTFTPNGTSADHWYRIGPDSTTSGETVIALGGQLEVGSFPTSYIPTEGVAVTRAADVASISGSNFSSWHRQDEGTVFADAVGVNNISGATRRYLEISDGTTSERTFLGYSSASNGRFFITDNGTTQADINVTSTFSPKMAAGYVANGIQMAANGVLGTEDTSANLPTVDRLILGSQDSSTANTFLNGTIHRLTYWDTRLPNEKLKSVTA
jgi:hypothetical protein